MDEDFVRAFATGRRVLVVAAAGCGKTELIAKAVCVPHPGCALVLTHTNAGVRALRVRVHKKYAVPSSKVRVETIAAFAARLARAYPRHSGFDVKEPVEHAQFLHAYEAALRLLSNRHVCDALTCSYSGLFVDEYQDCSARQHSLIMALAEILPCRVVGDPLQAIYDFNATDPLPDWDMEVAPHFTAMPELTIPQRWAGTAPEIGHWLSHVRESLERSGTVEITGAPRQVQWVKADGGNLVQAGIGACRETALAHRRESVAAMQNMPNMAHFMARRLGRQWYQSMEESNSRDLIIVCRKLETAHGIKRTTLVLQHVCKCVSCVPDSVTRLLKSLSEDRWPKRAPLAHEMKELVDQARAVAASNGLAEVAQLAATASRFPGTYAFRREVLRDFLRVCELHDSDGGKSLCETAARVRSLRSRIGTRLPLRVVTRTHLVKGLEFDHAIVLDADKVPNRRHLYVALTRGARTLTVVSRSPVVAAL